MYSNKTKLPIRRKNQYMKVQRYLRLLSLSLIFLLSNNQTIAWSQEDQNAGTDTISDTSAWNAAIKENTFAAYEAYVKSHRSGEHVNEVDSILTYRKTIDADVGYSYGSTISYTEADGHGGQKVPMEDVQYGPEMQEDHAIKAIVNDSIIQCLCYGQTAGTYTEEGVNYPVKMNLYKGVPFKTAELSVMKDIKLLKSRAITIAKTKANVLYLAKESCMPWATTNGRLVTMCANAINVVWKFRTKGMQFSAGDTIYTVVSPDARIAFTAKGVAMNGIRKKAKK
jgi:hypothetical protein